MQSNLAMVNALFDCTSFSASSSKSLSVQSMPLRPFTCRLKWIAFWVPGFPTPWFGTGLSTARGRQIQIIPWTWQLNMTTNLSRLTSTHTRGKSQTRAFSVSVVAQNQVKYSKILWQIHQDKEAIRKTLELFNRTRRIGNSRTFAWWRCVSENSWKKSRCFSKDASQLTWWTRSW